MLLQIKTALCARIGGELMVILSSSRKYQCHIRNFPQEPQINPLLIHLCILSQPENVFIEPL